MSTKINITDWDKVRNYKLSPVENGIVNKAFQEMVEGNSSFEDRSSIEMEDSFFTFKHAWIMANIVMSCGSE